MPTLSDLFAALFRQPWFPRIRNLCVKTFFSGLNLGCGWWCLVTHNETGATIFGVLAIVAAWFPLPDR